METLRACAWLGLAITALTLAAENQSTAAEWPIRLLRKSFRSHGRISIPDPALRVEGQQVAQRRGPGVNQADLYEYLAGRKLDFMVPVTVPDRIIIWQCSQQRRGTINSRPLRTQTGSRTSDNGQCVDVACGRWQSRACVEVRPPTEEPPVFDPP